MYISLKHFRRLWLLPLLLLVVVRASADEYVVIDGWTYTYHKITNPTGQLKLGVRLQRHYYEFTNCTINMPAGGGAAIEIEGNVAIGVIGTLTVKGGDAKGYIGAGAGIHVPEGSSLIITPGGDETSCTVIATGGNAGVPNDFNYNDNSTKSAKYNGGAGGAGAGIGGNGGHGGEALAIFNLGGGIDYKNYGRPSYPCGDILIDRGVTVTATGGMGSGYTHRDAWGNTKNDFDWIKADTIPYIGFPYTPLSLTYDSWSGELTLHTERPHYNGGTWATLHDAWGGPGGLGGGGGGYPAAGIGGGGSGGGAGGIGGMYSYETNKAVAAGHGGNGGGGGTGYGINGQWGIGGGCIQSRFGLENMPKTEAAEYTGQGLWTLYKTAMYADLYTGRNAYWGQKNFSGMGHAEGQTGSVQIEGVRPGTFLDGGKGAEPIPGSDVKTPGYDGGGVLFDSRAGKITIRGHVNSYANGAKQDLVYNANMGWDNISLDIPYFINDIGHALPGKYNPYTVILQGGTINVRAKGTLTFKKEDYNYGVANTSSIRIKEYTDDGSYTNTNYSLPKLSDSHRHRRIALPHSALYYSQVQGQYAYIESYDPVIVKYEDVDYLGYCQTEFDDPDLIHTSTISLNSLGKGWAYLPDGWWGNINKDCSGFEICVDNTSNEDRIGILKFEADTRINDGALIIGESGLRWHSGEGMALTTKNTFSIHFNTVYYLDASVKFRRMRWEPIVPIFSGKGGRNYELESITADGLPVYKNNNTDGSAILGYYTEPATVDGNGQLQLHGKTFSSIREFVNKGFDKIYAVTWYPDTDIVIEFSGDGGRDFELESMNTEALPIYKNNNTDGTEIFGFYSKPVTYVGGSMQVNGEALGSIKEFLAKGYTRIYAVIWNPSTTLTALGATERGVSVETGTSEAVIRSGMDNASNILMERLGVDKSLIIKVNKDSVSVLSFKYYGKISVQIDDEEVQTFESKSPRPQNEYDYEWQKRAVKVPAGKHTIKITGLGGAPEKWTYNDPVLYSYIYGIAADAMPTLDPDDFYRVTNTEELDAMSILINYKCSDYSEPKKIRFVGDIETSAKFETFKSREPLMELYIGTLTGGHIILTTNEQLVKRAWKATFSDMTISGNLVNKQGLFAQDASNTSFINCKASGSISNTSYVCSFASGVNSTFTGCVSDANVTLNGSSTSVAGLVTKSNTSSTPNTLTDCAFTGTVYRIDETGEKHPATPFVIEGTVENSFSTFDPGLDSLSGTIGKNVYVLADAEEQRGNYSTKTTAQFASGEVGYLLAEGGESHWHTTWGAAYPEYDAANLYTHAHLNAAEGLVLTDAHNYRSSDIYTLAGMEYTVQNALGDECRIYLNDSIVSDTGLHNDKAEAGLTLLTMKDFAEEGYEFEYKGIRYVVLTVPEGDTPGTVMTKPGEWGAYGNPDLEGDIIIPETVTKGGTAFTVTEIGDYSLSGDRVSSITLPETLTTIGESGMRGLSGITSIHIPGSVSSLGYELFKSCHNLKEVTFGYGSQITAFPQSAFEETGLTNVVLSENVTELGKFAFFRCPDLETVVLPSGLTSMGLMAFGDQNNLNTVVYLSEDPVNGSYEDFAKENYSNATLYALASARDEYESREPWKNFSNVVWCGLTLDRDQVELYTDEMHALTATHTLPPTAQAGELKWESSDPAVAAVSSDGEIYALSPGTATVKASMGNYTAICEVAVNADLTGLGSLNSDRAVRLDVYNLQGVCLLKSVTDADLGTLAPGYYIVVRGFRPEKILIK